jgi:ankyrin repeat protein
MGGGLTKTKSLHELVRMNSYSQNEKRLQNALSRNSSEKEVNSVNGNGFTPLMTAVHMGDVRAAELLLDHKAKVEGENILDKTKRSPLMEACFEGYVDMVKLLIERGADVEAVDDQGWVSSCFIIRFI